jgi:hypothetical protein
MCVGYLMVDIGVTGEQLRALEGINSSDAIANSVQPTELMLGVQGFRGMRSNCRVRGARCLDTGVSSC